MKIPEATRWLCLQDLSIECIDGLASILSPHHYEKYLSEGTRMELMPFMCFRLFDNDELKPFDITTVKGYWNQQILKKAASLTSELSDEDLIGKGPIAVGVEPRPNKRIRLSKGCHSYPNQLSKDVSTTDNKDGEARVDCCKENCANESNDCRLSTLTQCLTVGSQVEVLCQDSGIRGCWFRGLIIKTIKNKVKVRYQDLRNAIDHETYLEEWLSAFRSATPDSLGIRIPERTMLRPSPPLNKIKVCGLNVGSVVDAWWCDGWWEGITVKKESEEKFTVYFPGEKQEMIFNLGDLRYSLEWVNNGWQSVKAMPELVPMLLSGLEKETKAAKIADSNQRSHISQKSPEDVIKIHLAANREMRKQSVFSDLSKDGLLVQFGWKSKKKRSFLGNCLTANNKTGRSAKTFANSNTFDAEDCKYLSHRRLSSSPVTPLTSFDISL